MADPIARREPDPKPQSATYSTVNDPRSWNAQEPDHRARGLPHQSDREMERRRRQMARRRP